jgi:hypothetical protein
MRFNPTIVYPVGKSHSIRRTPGSGPNGTWEVLNARPDPKTKELPVGFEILETGIASGKLARAMANELDTAANAE